ncbi:rod shape-determining protein RodA [Crocinitomicaceae bacterium]|jgi:rod shape determining protein RodA|nr:rod shape-determining protein RodA [Flavobacteriales bacterium]MDA7761969.1 rod shape-determining protein RodA [Crocinitomicaceae bacterium]MDA8910548.1 rod shape-determining protein RodA [Crocinitomicaceae bacterium]
MRKSNSLINNLDWPLLIGFLTLISFGLMTIYSVAFNEENPSVFSFSEKYGKQIMWIFLSLFLGVVVFLIDSDVYKKFALPIYLVTIGLLVLVLFMPPINGARAWIGVGSMGIQPAEFAKITTALLLAKYVSDINLKLLSSYNILIALVIIVIPMGLILLQPDAGTFVVFTAFFFVLYREGLTFDPFILKFINLLPKVNYKNTWIGSHFIPILFVLVFLSILTILLGHKNLGIIPGLPLYGSFGIIVSLFLVSVLGILFIQKFGTKREKVKIRLIIILSFIVGSASSYFVEYSFVHLADHQKDRIELFLGLKEDPNGKDYNRNRAMAAVGSGGFSGKGYKNASVSSVKTNHVPESETDFIFCPFAEEWGFLGGAVLLMIYLFIIIRILVIAERQRSTFNRIYAYSVGMFIFYHFAINIGMNIGFAPVIGIPLPFFSYGGSSMMSFSIMVFILLKLDSQRRHVLR